MAIFLVKIQPAVKKETVRIAVGTLILSALMVLVFVLIGKFDWTVLTGALLGSLAAIGNFFLLALSVQKAAEKMNGVQLPSYEEAEAELEDGQELPAPDAPELQQAKRAMQASYSGRLFMLAIVGILGLTLSCFHAVATVLPFLFPRIIIFFYGISTKKEA